MRLATQRKSLHKFNLRPLATTYRSVSSFCQTKSHSFYKFLHGNDDEEEEEEEEDNVIEN